MIDSSVLKQCADEYVDFRIDNRKITIPYSIVRSRFQLWNTLGKPTVEQIKNNLNIVAQREGAVLELMSAQEITGFMKKHKLGIECSGYAYHLLDKALQKSLSALKEKQQKRALKHCFYRQGLTGLWDRLFYLVNPVRRVSADKMTNDDFTSPISRVKDVRPGDLIRLTPEKWRGKHVAVVIAVNDSNIIYTHSSRYTEQEGPHYAQIMIKDKEKGIGAQDWQELTKDGSNYGEVACLSENGDGVRRLKCLS